MRKLVAAIGRLFCFAQVNQSTVGIKERFGRFEEVLDPGCHCVPWIIGSRVAGKLTLRLRQMDVRCETKTKDNVFVTIVASIQYRAMEDKASHAYYKLSNPKSQIQSYVFDVIRASIPKLELDDVFEQKNEIAKSVEQELEKAMFAYGYEIVQTLIIDIEPDEKLHGCVLQQMIRQRQKRSFKSRELRERLKLSISLALELPGRGRQ
ncbi:hypothetical protein ACQ4PT_062708 [Festuca glaucescens]